MIWMKTAFFFLPQQFALISAGKRYFITPGFFANLTPL
jgi:hypothetical protein